MNPGRALSTITVDSVCYTMSVHVGLISDRNKVMNKILTKF